MHLHERLRLRGGILLLLSFLVLSGNPLWARNDTPLERELQRLRLEIEELKHRDALREREMQELRQQMAGILNFRAQTEGSEPHRSAEQESKGHDEDGEGSSHDRHLAEISLDVIASAGASTRLDSQLAELEGGGHDPRKRGFTFNQAELSLAGGVTPYLDGEAHVVFLVDPYTGESDVELEEAFLRTRSLPAHLQLKAGYYLTEFGRTNSTHPHSWDWLDQPVINTRLFGPDGLRAPGARLSWRAPLPWHCEVMVGAQNARGETLTSFIHDTPVGGMPVQPRHASCLGDVLFSLRTENFWNLRGKTSFKMGLSGLWGGNGTGASGHTCIACADTLLEWLPEGDRHEGRFLVWQTEFMARDYRVAPFVGTCGEKTRGSLARDSKMGRVSDTQILAGGQVLRDWGLTSQLLYGFASGWAAGFRAECIGGSGDGRVLREADPLRADRRRFSPLLTWQMGHFARLRAQYNLDLAQHLEHRTGHSIWLGVEFLVGTHPPHED